VQGEFGSRDFSGQMEAAFAKDWVPARPSAGRLGKIGCFFERTRD